MSIPTATVIDTSTRLAVVADVLQACRNEESMHFHGLRPFAFSDPRVSPLLKLKTLLEKTALVAENSHLQVTPDRERLYHELTHLAAVAVAWAESLQEEQR